MSSHLARKELRWRPRHDATETLAATIAAARVRGVPGKQGSIGLPLRRRRSRR